MHPVLARVLGDLHRAVGVAEQLFGCRGVARISADADADADAHRATRAGRQLDRIAQTANDAPGDLLGETPDVLDVAHEQQELVPAGAREHVAGADRGAQPVGDGPQHEISGRISVRVVHLAEVVDVDPEQRDLPVVDLRGGQRRRQCVAQRGAVGQSGQRVDARGALAATPSGDAHAHVLLHAEVPHDLALLVELRGKGDLVPERRPVAAVVDQRHVRVAALGERAAHDVDGPGIGLGTLQHAARSAEHLGGGVAGELLEALGDVEQREAGLRRVGDDDSGQAFAVRAHVSAIGRSAIRP